MAEDSPPKPRPSPGRWLIGIAALLAMAAVGLATAWLATARRNAVVSSPEERCAIAAEIAAELQANWAGHELPSMTAKAHAGGIDLLCPAAPVGDGGIDSAQRAGLDLDEVIEAGQLAELAVKMLHEKVPTYPWRCEIRRGGRCVARAHYDAIRRKIVFDRAEPE